MKEKGKYWTKKETLKEQIEVDKERVERREREKEKRKEKTQLNGSKKSH